MQTRQVFLGFVYMFTVLIATQLRKGVSGSRGDDTQSLKSAILDWIIPQGQALSPPLTRNKKYDWGFKHETTGALLCLIDLDRSNIE